MTGNHPTLRTPRLILRPWRPDDLPAFAALNADPVVMEHFPAVLDRAGSDALAGRIADHFAQHGYGLWALEVPGRTAFAGYVGLAHRDFPAHFTPAVEIGWRLARDCWGHGYAVEAARRVLDFAFDEAGLDEVVSFTVPANRPSWTVMERIGMARDADGDFDHPALPPGHALAHHVLYRIARPVRHVCIFRAAREITAEEWAGLHRFAAEMLTTDPAIRAYRFVPNTARKSQGYGLVLHSEFASRAALAAYVRTPLHERLARFMDGFIADTIVADY
ncbi:RimJ/RimL family protein N-acetyltransferase [Stella humosa]|uniref:RimJ/RimL family protein N-acetyltransferase n=1 Tax=Stella humosa TaxID=94 RepID=A0A3N1MCD4_9PROT|nr:GNAT family N-acetyltransferase [Stella humosa]ROQ00410.1 RimJ/RimL family protein N-acetyltransferase [Stella humosa]BBK30347.1 hypothetical protein STHU_09810 [Stella humosa]